MRLIIGFKCVPKVCVAKKGFVIKQRYTTAQWIHAIIAAFENLGLDSKRITQGLWDYAQNMLQGGSPAELASVRKMWHRADAAAQDPLLGLKMGLRQDNRSIGPLAPVIWHSPTVRVAINNITRFQSIISEGGTFHIHFSSSALDQNSLAEVFRCEYVPTYSLVPINPHQALALMIGFVGVIKAVSNDRIKVNSLYVPTTLNAALLSKQLGCHVENGDGNIQAKFVCEGMDQAILGVDAYLYQLNLTYAEELLRNKQASLELISSIKGVVESNGFSTVTIDDVGQHLGLHKRILQRQLAQQGTSFRRLKEEVLKEHCLSLLLTETVEITEVAQQLGYSEPSAFHRAFKAWFDMSPKQYCAKPYY